jgi:hypothetical protein
MNHREPFFHRETQWPFTLFRRFRLQPYFCWSGRLTFTFDRVCAALGHCVGPVAAENELQLASGLLATARCMAGVERGITPLPARIGLPHGSGLGKTRWRAKRSIAWLHSFRRLKIRYER